ncbi:MAG: hypothetical protein JSR33_03310 [Proteobacteria bacterium]|nr:hypothetical protein [Pseudomonadota bacterium]
MKQLPKVGEYNQWLGLAASGLRNANTFPLHNELFKVLCLYLATPRWFSWTGRHGHERALILARSILDNATSKKVPAITHFLSTGKVAGVDNKPSGICDRWFTSPSKMSNSSLRGALFSVTNTFALSGSFVSPALFYKI